MSEEMDLQGASIIPPGHVDVAMRLSQLPQGSEYDCFVSLDPLTMAGLNEAASVRGSTVDEVAREAIYFWLRFWLAEQAKDEPEETASSDDEARPDE